MVQAQPFFEFLAVGRNQVDTKLVRIDEDIAAGVAITLGELGDQLLDDRLCHGEDALLVTLLESDFIGERLFEQPLQVRYKRRRLAFASLRVAALAGLELILFRWATGATLVLLD